MSFYTATYSPDDNKLRLYAGGRLPAEVYARVKAYGFKWAPKQDLFVAPMWTPEREDLLLELCGEVGDEDTGLCERAEQRAERFEEYSDKRASDAESARKAVSAIADNIPFGQPILVGHHSERHARRDAEKIESGMRRAVKMWETSKYWEDRARGAILHAKYKERPDVRARRIKGLEADRRKLERGLKESAQHVALFELIDRPEKWKPKSDGSVMTREERADYIAGRVWLDVAKLQDGRTFTAYDCLRLPVESRYHDAPAVSIDDVIAKAQRQHEAYKARAARWVAHYDNRLAYERAMLADAGGTIADRKGPEVGGACKCWASPRGGWSYIQKVNRVSVTVLDNWGNGGANFTRIIPFDKLAGIMTAAEVQEARDTEMLVHVNDTGFLLRNAPLPEHKEPEKPKGEDFEAMRESLRQGVQVVSAPQLFPTPDDIAARMAQLADIRPGHSVLEPSAGTGQLIKAVQSLELNGAIRWEVCELNLRLADALASNFKGVPIRPGDFLEKTAFEFGGSVDRVIMNPPFENGADIKHIQHALSMLKPGGRLVAICANGPRQVEKLQPIATSWEELPAGTFAGTGVRAALIVIDKGGAYV